MNTIQKIFGLVLMISTAFAQGGPGGPGGGGSGGGNNQFNGPRPSGRPDPAQVRVLEGAITDINLGIGLRNPSITVNNVQIRIGPVWFLLDNDFELTIGERVRVTAGVSTRAGDPYLHAIQIVRVRANVSLTLRNEFGVPIWRHGSRGSGPSAPPRGGSCLDSTTIKTVAGVVEDVNVGLGVQHPTLTLLTDTGAVLTFKLGPERVLLASDVELLPGSALKVKYTTSLCVDELLALEITDAEGDVLVLRTDDGLPAW
jgi:hypothetical protein